MHIVYLHIYWRDFSGIYYSPLAIEYEEEFLLLLGEDKLLKNVTYSNMTMSLKFNIYLVLFYQLPLISDDIYLTFLDLLWLIRDNGPNKSF